MKKLPLVLAFLLSLFACGGNENHGSFENSSNDQRLIDIAKSIMDGGIKSDLNAIIKNTWNMYNIVPSPQGLYLVSVRNRKIDIEDEIIVVGSPQPAFDSIKDKFSAAPFITYYYGNEGIENERTSCIEAGAEFKSTSVPPGTQIYNGGKKIYNLKITYEIIRDGSLVKLKLTASGDTFVSCCDLPVGKCSSVDFTSLPFSSSWFFLVKGTDPKGFVLQGYKDATGTELSDYYLAFLGE